MSKKNEIETFSLMDLDVTELERRLELAPNECSVADTATVKSCGGECESKFKTKVE